MGLRGCIVFGGAFLLLHGGLRAHILRESSRDACPRGFGPGNDLLLNTVLAVLKTAQGRDNLGNPALFARDCFQRVVLPVGHQGVRRAEKTELTSIP